MDNIQKVLKKLSTKERQLIKDLLLKLMAGDFLGLDIQKLKGYNGIFRLRKGNLRIIYKQGEKNISLLAIERRSKKTYRDF